MKFSKLFVVALLVCGMACMTGCGKDKDYRKVTGTVTMNGEPLADCVLTFTPVDSANGEGGGGMTDSTGAYTVTSARAENGGTGLKPGDYKVTAMKNEAFVDEDQAAYDKGEITYDELQARKAKKGAYAKSKGGDLITPKKFLDPALTPLTITVTNDPKQNVFDFNLDE